MHNKNHLKASGVFVVRSRQTLLAGVKSKAALAQGLAGLAGSGSAGASQANLKANASRRALQSEMTGKMVSVFVVCMYVCKSFDDD